MDEDVHDTATVISGAGYRVTSVDQREPATLGDFLADGEIDIDARDPTGSLVRITGTARLDGTNVVLNEKDRHGKDARTWIIEQHGATFSVAPRAAF